MQVCKDCGGLGVLVWIEGDDNLVQNQSSKANINKGYTAAGA